MKTKLVVITMGFALGMILALSGAEGSAMSVMDATSFNASSGFAIYDSGSFDYSYDIAVQSDGRILVAGERCTDVDCDLMVLRFNSDGSPDTTFGTGGVFTYDSGGYDCASAIVVLQGGKIVVGGSSYDGVKANTVVLRLNRNGTLDTTFGTKGAFAYRVGNDNYASAVAIQHHGKILIVGGIFDGTKNNVLAIRLKQNGSLDTTFGTEGVFADKGENDTYASAVAIQHHGKILIVGGIFDGASDNILAMRLNSNGALDAGFGTKGIFTYGSGSGDYASSVDLLSDGTVLIVGQSYAGGSSDVLMIKLDRKGHPDSTFGAKGVARYNSGNDDYVNAGALQADGGILVIGTSSNGMNYSPLILSFDSDGSLNFRFSTEAIDTYKPEGSSYGNALAVQSDGKIVITGFMDNGINADIFVARYLP